MLAQRVPKTVQREAFGCPCRANTVELHRIGNVGFHPGGMTADARIARASSVGVGPVCLLDHRASETHGLSDVTAQHCHVTIGVAGDAIRRVGESVVGSAARSAPLTSTQ